MLKYGHVWLAVLFIVLTPAIGSCSQNANSSSHFVIYVTDERSGDLTEIDSSTLRVVATIHLGKRPRGIHASRDHRYIYMTLSGSPLAGPDVDESKLPPPDRSADGIGVFDVKQNRLVRILQCGSDPENFDITKDGQTIIVSNEDDAKATFCDIATGKVSHTVPVGEEPEGVKVTPDGKMVYITSEDRGTISVISVSDSKLVETIKVGRRPRNIAFLSDGSRAYVNAENDGSVTEIDTAKYEVIRTIALGERGVIKPMCVLLSPDSKALYVSSGRGHKLFVIDTGSNHVTASLDIGERPWGIDLSPDGKTLFSANGPSNDVSVVDLITNTLITKIKVGDGPWGILVVPD